MNNLQVLHRVVETHQSDYLKFGRRKVLIDALTARVLVKLYRSLGPEGKAKFERIVETESGFKRLLDFAWSKTRNPTRRITLKKGITEYRVPVWTVLHITETSRGETRAIGQSVWFDRKGAEAFAKEQSRLYPSPQRMGVYSPDGVWVSSWQSGKKLPAFEVVGR